MITCDLNCDMGEGVGNDAAIMPFITSANIACGYHAGDEQTILETILLAKKSGVAIGAHPSFLDLENFGRTEPESITLQEVYQLVTAQLKTISEITVTVGAGFHHVKPHGALYNMAARDATLANAIAKAVFNFDKKLVLFGLSGSFLISEAKAIGITTASEVFADRTYQDDGSLTPRSMNNALIKDEAQAVEQVLQMLKSKKVISVSGKEVAITADTICLHGDGENAIAFAKIIHEKLRAEGVHLRAL
jgi:UPF0271 protein